MTDFIFITLLLYFAFGVTFSLCLLAWGIGKFDANARNTGLAFKLIILPGLVALWPLVLRRFLLKMKIKSHD